MYYDKFINNFGEKNEPSKQYYEDLELFYSPVASCPKCKSTIDKSKEGDVIKMKCSKCKWSITIDVAKYVNIHDVLFCRKKRESDLMYQLTEKIKRDQKVDFDQLKLMGEYDIEHIFDDQKDKITSSISEQFKNIHKLYLLNMERKKVYNSIVEEINGKNREKLIKGYQEGKNIKEMTKDTGLTENTVTRWFEWLGIIKEYTLLINEIRKDTKKINDLKENYSKLNTHFLVKGGNVKESKEIKL